MTWRSPIRAWPFSAEPPQACFVTPNCAFFSRAGNYCERADLAHPGIAKAPDRGDFGKFEDTLDVFFGRYAALVCRNPDDNTSSATNATGSTNRACWVPTAR